MLGEVCWEPLSGEAPHGEELRLPANSHLGDLERASSRASPAVPGRLPFYPPWTTGCERFSARTSHSGINNPQKLSDINTCWLFEAGSVGIICYAAVDSYYKLATKVG